MTCIVAIKNPRRPTSYVASYGFASNPSEALNFATLCETPYEMMDLITPLYEFLHLEDEFEIVFDSEDEPS